MCLNHNLRNGSSVIEPNSFFWLTAFRFLWLELTFFGRLLHFLLLKSSACWLLHRGVKQYGIQVQRLLLCRRNFSQTYAASSYQEFQVWVVIGNLTKEL